MNIKRFVLGDYESNCYIISSGGKALVIDPGYVNNEIIPYLNSENLDVKYIYLTHGHFDHVGGVNQLKNYFPNAIVRIHQDDVIWLDKNELNMLNLKVSIDETFSDEHNFTIGNLGFRVIHTPGHSAGGIAILTNDRLFVGDTLFRLSIGRSDFPFGDYDTLVNSIKKLYLLPDKTVVYPGHGEATTIGFEKLYNYFVKG